MKTIPYCKDDEYQYLNGTLVFWDHRNSRAKITSDNTLSCDLLRRVKSSAARKGIGKIISFTPSQNLETFLAEDFLLEGYINGFFRGQSAICCSFFIDPARAHSRKLSSAKQKAQPEEAEPAPNRKRNQPYLVRNAIEKDISGIIRIFRYVFQSYPSPVFEKDYILENMRKHRVIYKLAISNNDIIGVASAEMDPANLNAEMTDCVTYPLFRSRGVLGVILSELETDLHKQDYLCLYTLCRAANPAVNRVFSRLGYRYSGCLVNNCHICGSYEDMNIRVKLLK